MDENVSFGKEEQISTGIVLAKRSRFLPRTIGVPQSHLSTNCGSIQLRKGPHILHIPHCRNCLHFAIRYEPIFGKFALLSAWLSSHAHQSKFSHYNTFSIHLGTKLTVLTRPKTFHLESTKAAFAGTTDFTRTIRFQKSSRWSIVQRTRRTVTTIRTKQSMKRERITTKCGNDTKS